MKKTNKTIPLLALSTLMTHSHIETIGHPGFGIIETSEAKKLNVNDHIRKVKSNWGRKKRDSFQECLKRKFDEVEAYVIVEAFKGNINLAMNHKKDFNKYVNMAKGEA